MSATRIEVEPNSTNSSRLVSNPTSKSSKTTPISASVDTTSPDSKCGNKPRP